ncbi:hypothetical protein CTAYLR_001974 [Chrysophaeum taylorii]|uniref:Uncharacterized protein n=1 Tax=Chrysophaeum taylorii TaxID=2483200 RepID=A0AAD7U8G4_9STRA|nr:hypothetical protein CTAYLR_001974 [Chrysophaeum taylorii]
MHSGHPERQNYTEYAKRTWLQRVPRHVIIDGVQAQRRLMHIFYDDNPGCFQLPCRGETQPHYLKIGKYFGAHRTIAGVLVANDTWPDVKWVLVVDDDDHVQLDVVRRYLEPLDADVPLLLAGRVGPGHNAIPCHRTNNNSKWSCCTDPTKPCRAYLYGPQAIWDYDKLEHTFMPKKICPEHEVSNYCCRSKPWPEGIHAGFPFRVHPRGPYRPHFSLLWPYGGLGYIVSRGMLDVIPRDHWQQCMYGFQCANADHRVMACVLNAGFSLTLHKNGIPGIKHHFTPPGMLASPSTSDQTRRHHAHYSTPTSRRPGPAPRTPRRAKSQQAVS